MATPERQPQDASRKGEASTSSDAAAGVPSLGCIESSLPPSRVASAPDDDGAEPASAPHDPGATAAAGGAFSSPKEPFAPAEEASRRKEEGNALFAAKRYDEAVASYKAGLDALLLVVERSSSLSSSFPPSSAAVGTTQSNKEKDSRSNTKIETANKENIDPAVPALAGGLNGGCAAVVVAADDAPPLRRRRAVERGETTEEAEARDEVEVALRSNLALVLDKLGRFEEAEVECTRALRVDPTAAKVWYRRAHARESLSSPDGAPEQTEGLLGLLPSAEADLVECISLLEEPAPRSDDGNPKRAQLSVQRKSQLKAAKDLLGRVRAELARRKRHKGQQKDGGGATARSEGESSRSSAMGDGVRKTASSPQDALRADAASADGGKCNGDGPAIRASASSDPTPASHTPLRPAVASGVGAPPPESAPGGTAAAVNGTRAGAKGGGGGPSPSPERQRQDVVRLLLARQMSAEGALKGNVKGKQRPAVGKKRGGYVPLDGEAYFLVDWKWWSTWCAHVDFFYRQGNGEGGTAESVDERGTDGAGPTKASAATKREAEVLRLLPPGASVPREEPKSRRRRPRSASSSSYSSSSLSSDSRDDEDDEFAGHGPRPGPLDNSSLLLFPSDRDDEDPHHVFYSEWRHLPNDDRNGERRTTPLVHLRPNLVRGHHYEVLPREVYHALRVWYGEATPSVCRRAAAAVASSSEGGDDDDDRRASWSELVLYPELRPGRCSAAAPPARASEVRRGRTAAQARACGACRRPDARSKCARCGSMHYCDRSCQSAHWPYHKPVCRRAGAGTAGGHQAIPPSVPDDSVWGKVGLNNLGNTCFMNSAIQCLSHAAPLTRHFLTNRFKSDLNPSNPLGTKGKLANAYDAVVKELWMGGHRNASVSPTALKRAVAAFAPRFAGVSQHDAQEFLAYLLDGLHEDLNRIRDAPYVEMPDVAGGSDMRIAGAKAWEAHLRRNDSLVLDTFYGQFKSTCVCPKCERVSVSFDAFNHVSLEIPQHRNRVVLVTLFKMVGGDGAARDEGEDDGTIDPPPPLKYGLTVPKNGSVADLKRSLSTLSGIPSSRLAICDVYEHNLYEILNDNKGLSTIRADDVIAAYEVDPYTNVTVHAIVTHSLVDASGRPSSATTMRRSSDDSAAGEEERRNLFGVPFLTSFDSRLTCREVWDHIWRQVRRMVSPGQGNRKNMHGRFVTDETVRSSLQIRVVGNDGKPRPVFLVDNANSALPGRRPGVMSDAARVDASSLLPPTSDERLTKFLGKDCTERFLFLSLEWTNRLTSDGTMLIDARRFVVHADHPSLTEAIQRNASLTGVRGGGGGVTLDQCFDTFTRPERLDEHNMWYCSKCREHVRAMKTMELWRLPNVLIVHLKRFEFRHALRRDKLETYVDCPVEGLDMSRHCASTTTRRRSSGDDSSGEGSGNDFVADSVPAMYDLFAVTNHYGRMGFGHYTSYARRWDEEGMSRDWALFDDSSVRSVGDGTGGRGGRGGGIVVTPAAYVLFYRRRTFS